MCVRERESEMSGGTLGVAGDILSVAFLCFICSLAIQLYCAFSRRTTRPPPPLPATISSPPPQPPTAAASKQLYLSRFQRSASCPVVSAIAPPPSPPSRLSSAYHMGCSSAGNVSPLACTVASQAHIADLAKLMRLDRGEEQVDVDLENFICMPPQRQLFTIKEEGKDEDATEQSNGASGASAGGSSTDWDSELPSQMLEKQAKCTSTATCAPASGNGNATCAHAPAAGLVSQVSSASSEGGVSLWSTSPCPSSPAVSYLSASSSPFPTSSPPRSSFWAQTSRFSNAT